MKVTIHASGLSGLFDCPARWAAMNLDGIRMPSGPAAHLGTSLHASTAVYDAARIHGESVTVDDAAGVFVDTLRNPDREVDWQGENIKKLETVGLRLHGGYCRQVAPHKQYEAVEQRCDPLDIEIDGVTLSLVGTLDRLRRTDSGQLAVSDIKSGARAVSAAGAAVTTGHAPQIGIYSLLAEAQLGQPVDGPGEVIGLNTGNGRVGTGEIEFPRAGLLGRDGEPGMLEMAAGLIKAGLFYGNSKSWLCSPKYCPVYHSCFFH